MGGSTTTIYIIYVKSKKFKLGTFAQSVTASFGPANPFSPISSKANAKQLSLELH